MSFDVTTLALAKSYADQHGGGGGGASTAGDFIIKMTAESDDGINYTVTSCDATIEQIDAAVSAEKRVVLIASVYGTIFELPMIQYVQEANCIFSAFLSGIVIYSSVYKVENESEWNFIMSSIPADNVGYSNDALPNISTVEDALNKLIRESHSHANKAVLDKFSETDGKPTYNGQALGGENTIYIPARLKESGDMPTIETSVTFEQIEAAYNLGQEQILKLVAEDSNKFIYMLPLVFASPGGAYYFETTINNQIYFVSVTSTNEWGLEFYDNTPTPKEEIVNDVLAALPTWTGGSY